MPCYCSTNRGSSSRPAYEVRCKYRMQYIPAQASMIRHSASRHRQSCHESTKQRCLLCSNQCPIRSGCALAVRTASSGGRALMRDTHRSRCCWEKVPRLPRLCSSYELRSHSPGGAMSSVVLCESPYTRHIAPVRTAGCGAA